MPANLKIALQEEIQALCIKGDARRFSSKTMMIREIYDDIENARKHGVTLAMILSLLREKDFDISYSELKQILYRIRKSKDHPKNNNKENKPPHTKTEDKADDVKQQRLSTKEQTEFDDLTRKIESFNAATGWVDRYVALGGDINDIKDQSESQKRQMTMQLKSSISRKLQLYKY